MSSKVRPNQPKRTRAEINRANAQKSTGPKTAAGKAASSQNAFKHGLYSVHACIPGEEPEKLDALRADLRAEHQPVSLTEEILVDELAHHYWRIKRYRYFETSMWVSQGRNGDGALEANTKRLVWMINNGVAALFQRALASAERALDKTLHTLRQTQKARQVVQPVAAEAPRVLAAPARKQASGFVSSNSATAPPDIAEMFAAAQANTGMSQSELLDLLRSVA